MKIILRTSIAAFSLGMVALPGAAQAAIVIDIEQNGSDVVGTVSGSLDLTGLTFFRSISNLNGGALNSVEARRGLFVGAETTLAPADAYQGIAGPSNWGMGGRQVRQLFSGDTFGIAADLTFIWLPVGYTSNTAIASTATFAGTTIANLGLDAGVYSYTTPNDTITVNIGQAVGAVPEPATWAFMIFGFGAVGGVLRSNRRRQKNTAQNANIKVSYA
ncbi:MAG: PEPxxWA-CTERM sorting domain-containing protein [Parasphingorhabdus sp.]|uniref:PEPxxWA-CTERM sorting domain-containing protein n=1 Tax=Parasphingorhabdus sp. TaxID=2709688 RepID=UPI00329A1EE7